MKKILVVDDDLIITGLIERKLSKDNFKIIVANDAIGAMNVLGDQKIDLIILDVLMPKLSGLTFYSMAKDFNGRDIPIIMISSINNMDAMIKSYNIKPAAFYSKPIDFEALINTINQVLSE